jgi:CelD/BcsL family acetyltransferase involved in cellulose biosynthesis
MTAAARVPLRFQVGARTLAAIPRRLVRVALSLDQALVGVPPVLPPVGDADGHLVTSLPEALLGAVAAGGALRQVRQRYTRYWVDLAAGREAWLATLSGSARNTLKRKTKRLMAMATIEAAATPDAVARLLPAMRAVAATTYQARLLGQALPPEAELMRLAAADRLRAWLLAVEGRPAAFLLGVGDGATLRYDHVGHDPRFADLSPGSVLMGQALEALMAEGRFARFDFTEGEGQHKRQLATGGVACADLLLLRPTLANRGALAALAAFDAGTAWGKRAATHPALAALAKRVRR